MRKTHLLSATALAFGAAAIAQPAYAQKTDTGDTANQVACQDLNNNGVCDADEGLAAGDTSGGQQIVVTGTRIARPNLDSTTPVTSVSIADLTEGGNVAVGDNLNDLPSLRSTYSQGNSTRFIGTSGLNLLDLRGLGISRTLVLVNGRRHVTASVGDYLVDVNTIPVNLLERVDIVTGGTSAVYGSDAVAGVVNFVLKRNFDGIKLDAQGGVSDKGDLGSQYVSLTAGKNFGDGRGNVAVALEYTNREALYFNQRDYLTGAFSGRSQFNLRSPVAGEPAAGNGIIDNLFFTGVRNGTIGDGGAVFAAPINCSTGTAAQRATRCTPGGNVLYYFFQPDGSLLPNNPDLFFSDITGGGSTNTIGGYGSTLRNTGQLFPQLERYAANFLAHYEITPALSPFIEAKYVRVNSFQEGQPSFFQGSVPGFFGGGSNFSCSNPYLTAQALATLQNIGRCNSPNGTFTINRFNVDFGGRRQKVRRETFRVVAGIEGNFMDDWHYEVSGNYGRFDENVNFLNNLLLFDINGNQTGFLNAIDAVRNAQGQIVCRVNQVAVTDPNCVPINVFGQQNYTQQQLNYIQTTGWSKSRAEELDLLAYVSGSTSRFFNLPGGPVKFSIGGEYRRETARQTYDPLTASGGTFLNAIQPFNPPALDVKEVFGELRIPIVKDLPFLNELSIEAAARYSDYNTAADKTFAWNAGAIYSPFPGLRFRGNYSKSVRVPTQSDLYSPLSQNFAFISDPCDVLYINNGPNRAANCAAAGVPANFANALARSQTTGYQSGGNPTLSEETGRSYTIGAVIEPAFMSGFSATVDYYNIRVTNLIASLSAQTIINQCYDAPNLNNPFCATVNRNPDGTFAYPAVISGGVNFARQDTKGIDFQLTYNKKFDNGDRLRARFIGTYVIELTNYINPVDPTFGTRQLSTLGDPQFGANASVNYDFGAIQLGYSVNYIGRQLVSSYEATHSFQGRPPTNADVVSPEYYPDAFYHNVRVQFDVTNDIGFYMGVDNIADTRPPYGLTGTAGGDPYNTIGRYLYAGFTAKIR